MNNHTRVTSLIQKLRSHGHRLTPQRLAILRILTESEAHPSVEEVYARVRVDFPMTSLATVYKTVAMLKEEGEILEIGLGGSSSRYDAAKPHPHPHLICTQCQKILDPHLPLLVDVSQELAQKYGFQITNQRMDFFGICPDCQQKSNLQIEIKGERK